MITEFFRLDTAQAEAAVERFTLKAGAMEASLETMARGAELVAQAELKQVRATRLAEEAVRKKAEATELAKQAEAERRRGNTAEAARLQARSEKALAQSVETTKKSQLATAKAERARVQAQKLMESSSRRVLTVQERLNRALGRAVSLIGRQVAAAGLLATTLLSVAGAVRAVGDGIETFATFEHRMAGVSAVTHAVGFEFEALRERAEEMGETTLLSASQASAGMELLGRSGFAVREILDAIPAVLDLAVAGTLDLGTAADLVANLIRAFQLEADQAGFVIDVLAATATSANTDLTMLGESFKFVASLASGLGLALPSISGALGVLANVGLRAEMGGTGLRMAILSLANATPKTQRILESFGVSLDEVDFVGEGLEEVLLRLRDAGLGVNEAFAIAGARGGNALNVLISRAGEVEAFAEKLQHVEGAGKAMAATMADTVRGALTLLASRFEALQIQFGTALEPQLRQTIDSLAEIAQHSKGVAQAAGEIVGAGMSAFVNVLEAVSTHGDVLLSILAALAAGLIALPLASTIASFWGLVRAQTALGVVQNTVLLTTIRMKEAWTAMTAAMARNPAGLVAVGIAALAGVLTLSALRSAEAREEAERYHAALEAGFASVENASAAQDDLLARLAEERTRRRELSEALEENRARLEELEPLAARMAEVLDMGDAEGLGQLTAEARELGLALGDVGRETAFQRVAAEIELAQAKIASLRHEADVASRSIVALESSFGESSLEILDSLVERRREVTSVLLAAREEALELERQLEALRFDETNPTLYAQAVNRINRSLAETRATAKAAETGLEGLDRQLSTTADSIEKAGNTLEIFTRSQLVDAARASIDELFRTGDLERAEQVLRRLPKDVLRSVFPGQTVDEILAWQRQLSAAFEELTQDLTKNEQEQAKAAQDLLKSLERLQDATSEQQALRHARDLDRVYEEFWGRFIDFQEVVLSNEALLGTALQAGLDPLRFVTGEYSTQTELLVRQLTLETAINDKTAELVKKKGELVDRQRELVEAQNEFERNLQEETQIRAEERVLGTGPDLSGDDPEAFLPTPEEMRRYGEGLVEDFRDEWADGIDALKGLWRTALDSILEEGTISFESLGEVINDIFHDVFARMVDQAIESMFVMQSQAAGLQAAGGAAAGGGLLGGGGSSFLGLGSAAASVLGVAAIAVVAYEIADAIIEKRKGRKFSLPIEVGFSSTEGFSGQAIGGNVARDTGLDFVQVYDQITNRIQDLRLAIGGILEFLPEIAIQVRRDGQAFKLAVGGWVISSFETLEDAIQAGLEFALRDAEFSGLGPNMQALLQRLGRIGLENADPLFELARTLDNLGLDEVTVAFQDLNTLFSVYTDQVRRIGGSEADLLRFRNEALRELGEQVRDTLGQFVEGFQSLARVRQLLDALRSAGAFNAGLAGEADFRDRFLDRVGDGSASDRRGPGGGPSDDGFRVSGPVIAMSAALEEASDTASAAISRTVTAIGDLQVGLAALPATSRAALVEEQSLRVSAGDQWIATTTRSARAFETFGRELGGVEGPMEGAGKALVDLGNAAGEIAPPIARLPDELRDAAADIPPAIDAAFAQLAIENEAARLQASLSAGLADFLGNEEQRREAERLTHQLKLAQMRMELEALRILARETGAIAQDVIDRYDRLLTDAERRLASGQGPRRRRRGVEGDSRRQRRDELARMLEDLRSGLTGAAAEIDRTRRETERLAQEMRELGFVESDVADFVDRRREAETARVRETQLGLETELARLAGDRERVALLEREAALVRIDSIEREMEALHQLGAISDEALAGARAAAEAARQGVNDAFEAEHGFQTRRRAYLDELARIVPEIGDFRAFQELRDFLSEIPQRAEDLGLASERLRNQLTRGLELNFFEALSRFSGPTFDNEDARQREQELRDRQALMNLRLQLALLEEFGNLSEAQLEQYRGWVAEVEAGLENGNTVVDRDQVRQELSAKIPSLAVLLEVEQTIAFFDQLADRLRSIGATEEEILAARQEGADTLFAGMLENLARATGNEHALRVAAELRHRMEVANHRLRLQLLEQEGILTEEQAEVIRGLINDFEAMEPDTGPQVRFIYTGYVDPGPQSTGREVGPDPERLRDQVEKTLESWRALALDDVTREARDLLRERAELEETIAELARLDPGADLPEIEEAFAVARESFLDRFLGTSEDAELDEVSRELAGIFSHFQSLRSALEELGGSAEDFGRVAETEARRLAEFEKRLFAPVDAELEAIQGTSRSESENRAVLVHQFRDAIARFQAGDLSAASDAVGFSQQLRSQIDQLQIPGERQALLSFLESQLSSIREAGIPAEALDVQERLADFSGRQLETQERIAQLLEQQNALFAENGNAPAAVAAAPLGPIRVEVSATFGDQAFQAGLERRLDRATSELSGVSKKLDKLAPIVAALQSGNTQRQQMLSELRKSKGVST